MIGSACRKRQHKEKEIGQEAEKVEKGRGNSFKNFGFVSTPEE